MRELTKNTISDGRGGARSIATYRKSSVKTLSLAIAMVVAGGLAQVPSALAKNVTGELTDSSKKTYFQGAIVKVEELNLSSTTDNQGRFRINGVPAGSYTLLISYVGAEPQRIKIEVPADGLVMGEVVFGVSASKSLYAMEDILVTGQAAAMASAINQQRAADNIKSVLDTDAMGQWPDQNVAESLRRVAGISVENDMGEGRYVVIRGMDPDLNATSINGVRATSSEDRRALQLDVIPSDLLDGLEVQKSLTPDMDGDAIGGSINIKTLSAFNRKGLFVKGRVEGGFNEFREKWSPKASFAASNIFELDNGRRLGIAGALSWQDRKLGADNNEGSDWEVADNGQDYMEEFDPRFYTTDRERIGAALNLDYDLSDNTTIFGRSLYSKFQDTEVRYRGTYKKLDLLAPDAVANGVADYGEAQIKNTTKDRVQTAETLSVSFGSESQWDVWGVKTNVGYSYAEETDPDKVDSAWKAKFESGSDGILAGTPVLSLNHSNNQIPVVESDYFAILRDPLNYELDEIASEASKVDDTQWSFQIDATRDVSFGEVKFGAKARTREKTHDENALIYEGDGTYTMADALDPGAASAYGFPNQITPMADLAWVRARAKDLSGLELDAEGSEIDSTVNDWQVEENIYAGYGMVKYNTDRMVITAGLRVEYTDFSSTGNQVDVTDTGVVITGLSSDKTYTDVLPSMNIRYDISEELVGRAAISRSIVRPGFADVASRISVEDGEASVGNPDLEPYNSWNYDASVEFYPSQLSVLSVGVFYKEVDNFIFIQSYDDYTHEGVTYDEVTIAQNGEQATVLGLELNYQQHFGFLPSPFDGFLINVNLTQIDGDAETDGRSIPLPKQADTLMGFTLGYEKYGFDFRLAMKYRDRYLDEIVSEEYDRYTDEHSQWDFTAKYRFSDNWTVYGEFSNLTNEPEFYYAGKKNRLLQYDDYGRTSVIGIQYTLN